MAGWERDLSTTLRYGRDDNAGVLVFRATPGTVLTIHTRWTVAKPSLVSASGLGERDLSITMTLQSK